MVSLEPANPMQRVRSEIGRGLREHFKASMAPLPDRLAELVRKLELLEAQPETASKPVVAGQQGRRWW